MKQIKPLDLQSGADYTDEHLLLLHIQANVPAARRWLYDRYGAAMYGQLLVLLPEEQQAKDVLVKVFEALHEIVGNYNKSGGLSLFSWLLKKTREYATMEYPEATLTSNCNKNTLVEFYSTLTEQCQQAFVLAYCKGISRQSIAERMGMDVPKVNELLREAMIAFRKYTRK